MKEVRKGFVLFTALTIFGVCVGCTAEPKNTEQPVAETEVAEQPSDENLLDFHFDTNGDVIVDSKMVEDILYSQSDERLNGAHVDLTYSLKVGEDKVPMILRMDPIGTRYKFAEEEGEIVVRDKENNDSPLFMGRLCHKADVESIVFDGLLSLWYPISDESQYFLSEGNVNGNDVLLFLRSKESLENGVEADFLVIHIANTDQYIYINPLGDALTTIDILGRLKMFVGEEAPEENFDMDIVDQENWEELCQKETVYQEMFLNLK